MGRIGGLTSIFAACVAAASSVFNAAMAEDGVGQITSFDPRWFANARLRYEGVEDDNFELRSDALTIRLRAGFESAFSRNTRILTEFEAIGAFVDNFDDAVGGSENRPVIADAEIAELNRFQLSTSEIPQTEVIFGRQRIVLDDERFVGRVAFRQNEQTYDAVRATTEAIGPFIVDVAYVRRVNRILSRRSDVGRFRGDSYLVNVSVPTPVGQLTGFHYALDLETGDGPTLTNANSSRTTGVRLAGRRHWDEISLHWEGSYATQSDFADAPIDYSAEYWVAGIRVDAGPVFAGFRTETLGSGNVGFQTPVGTLHRFQGAADVFLVTPPDGIVDRTVSLGWRIGEFGAVKGVLLSARHHWFRADAGTAFFGEETDIRLAAKLKGTTTSIEFADYRADAFAEDVSRIWFTLERSF
ncbi:MAG: alginate export family protein [Pseudomonadota bacterium]